MNIILLSGGSGKRLWPLSNDIRSKQFIKLFKRPDGSYESMIERVYRQIRTVDPEARVTIATSRTQVSSILNLLGTDVNISVEPTRRDTFPAIALASAYLHEKCNVLADESVVVCPVDPYVNDDYFHALKALSEQADKGEANLVLMGIQPTYPSEKYGYIIPETKAPVSTVRTFKEKPDEATAREYLKQGALWNGGVFAYKLGYVLDRARTLLDTSDYQTLFDHYAELRKISFDYAVVEHEEKIQVMCFHGEWKDLGTWNTLTEEMSEPVIGHGILGEHCEDVHIVNELSVPILAMGLEHAVISASPQGILVSNLEASARIKPYVDQLPDQIMFARKSWGDFRILDVSQGSMTVKIEMRPGAHMSYHAHHARNEIWTVLDGRGTAIVDDEARSVCAGDVISIPCGAKHTMLADPETPLMLMEMQLGDDIAVTDKAKFDMPEDMK